MKKLTKIALFGVCSMTAMSMSAPSAFAQSIKDQRILSDTKIQVSVSVTKGCTMTLPSDFDFGIAPQTWDRGSASTSPPPGSWRNRLPPGKMTVTCTKGTFYDLTFKGSHDQANDSTRRYMTLVDEEYVSLDTVGKKATPDNKKILYYIRRDSSFGPGLGDKSAPPDRRFLDNEGSGDPKDFFLYLIVDQKNWNDHPPVPGKYQDQVTAEVTF